MQHLDPDLLITMDANYITSLLSQKDAQSIKEALRSIIQINDPQFLKTQHSVVCTHIASQLLSPEFSSVITKHDVTILIVPVFNKAPVQGIQSILNTITNILNADADDTQRELNKNHLSVLIDVLEQVISTNELLSFVLIEIRSCNIPSEIVSTVFATLPEKIYNAIVYLVPDSNFGKIRTLIPRSFQPKYDRFNSNQ
jgi:hypothetical protein